MGNGKRNLKQVNTARYSGFIQSIAATDCGQGKGR
nr:MAG TPA: hypothetical protein [Caudoviricetes sp.]